MLFVNMFPHTITLYNVEIHSDPDTVKDTVTNHITILRGVLLEASKAMHMRQSGPEGSDVVKLHIPFDVTAVDGSTGEPKKHVGPLEFWSVEDKTGLWTMFANGTKTRGVNGSCFFVKGKAVHPGLAVDAIEKLYDHVYNITTIADMDFGGLQHWEIGAR